MMISIVILFIVLVLQIQGIICFSLSTYRAIRTSKFRDATHKFAVRSMLNSISQPTGVADILLKDRTLIEHGTLGTKKTMVWNGDTSSFQYHSESKFNLQRALHGHFFPSGELTPDYYKYAMWRATQRLVSATNGVFGTQALLMALGFNKKRIGVAAATAWVLKDCLGKVSRIFWASVNGRKFDGDAKKWRFRASLLFVLGNALEIVTYVFPAFFLVTAALANAMKQMAMVTSSATRNAIYKSFSRNNDNIGDITAKGEAQIAVIDLLGLLIGIKISKLTRLSKAKIVSVFVLLSMVDLYCVYHEIRSVVFHVLNFERCDRVLPKAFSILEQRACNSSSPHSVLASAPAQRKLGNVLRMDETSAKSSSTAEVFFEVETDMDVSLDPYSSLYAAPTSATSTTATTTTTSTMTASATADAATATSTAGVDPVLQQMNPAYVARHEQLLLPSLHGEGMIQTWSTLAEPDAGALQQYVQYAVRHKENVVVVPSARLLQSRLDAYLVNIGVRRGSLRLVGGVPVVMTTDLLVHTAASPLDIFRALVQVNHMTCELNRGASSGASMIDNRRIGNSNGVVTVEQAVAVLQGVPKECIRSAQLRSRAFQRNLVQDAVQRVGQVIRNIRHSDVNNSPTNTCTASNASGASNEEVGGSEFNAYSTELDAEQVLLEQLGVGRHSLFERYQRAHRFEGENLSGIMSLLKEAGWAADRFMFGAINRRVEW